MISPPTIFFWNIRHAPNKSTSLDGPNCKIKTSLFNKILLIGITRNKPIINMNIMRDSFHKQASGFTHMKDEMKLTKNYGI